MLSLLKAYVVPVVILSPVVKLFDAGRTMTAHGLNPSWLISMGKSMVSGEDSPQQTNPLTKAINRSSQIFCVVLLERNTLNFQKPWFQECFFLN